MKKIDLGQTVTILANFSILAGLIFLSIELRQNNEIMVADAEATRLSILRLLKLKEDGVKPLERQLSMKAVVR